MNSIIKVDHIMNNYIDMTQIKNEEILNEIFDCNINLSILINKSQYNFLNNINLNLFSINDKTELPNNSVGMIGGKIIYLKEKL